MTIRSRLLALALAGVSGITFSAAAAAYSSVYVFGDSLSDMGNVYGAIGFPAPPDYATGRFSNGPVAAEVMTQQLTGAPLTLDHDYAWGGARTGVSPISGIDNNQPSLNGTGLQTQVTRFQAKLGGAKADPNALYMVWIGANDFTEPAVLTDFDGQQWNRMIGNVTTAINNLAAEGAQHFFVPNIPNLGLTPRLLGSGFSALATAFTNGYNASFAASLAALDAANTSIDIKTFDVYSFMNVVIGKVQSDGSYLGLTNVTTPCQNNPACTDPSQAFFWDDQHPTARIHEILGTAFAQAVPEPQTYALLLAGLGVVVAATRRQRRLRV